MKRTVRAHQGETLDALLYRVYGVTAGITEKTLRMNRHLAALGPQLPEGTAVELPAPPAPVETQKPKIQLWD